MNLKSTFNFSEKIYAPATDLSSGAPPCTCCADMLRVPTRPVGLSVLGGIFLVVATVDLLGEIALLAGLVSHLVPGFDPGWLPPVLSPDFFRTVPLWYLAAASIVLWPAKIGLLVGAALAFLAQKRRGRTLTNIYVVVSLVESVATVVANGMDVRAVAAVFPILVLVLVNKVFAEDLIHP
jgi:hypothetical protein